MDDLTASELGKLMREARENKRDENGRKISRDVIAKEIGVAGQTIYEWENGNRQPNFINVLKFCKYLGLTLDDLLGVKKNVCLPY
jgi:DNA-binding XRE family transcriptional regulator